MRPHLGSRPIGWEPLAYCTVMWCRITQLKFNLRGGAVVKASASQLVDVGQLLCQVLSKTFEILFTVLFLGNQK